METVAISQIPTNVLVIQDSLGKTVKVSFSCQVDIFPLKKKRIITIGPANIFKMALVVIVLKALSAFLIKATTSDILKT